MGKIVFLVFLFCTKVHAQDIDVFACSLVQIFKQKDSSAFTHLPIQPGDSRFIFENYLKDAGVEVNDSNENLNQNDSEWVAFTKQVISAFIQLHKKAIDFGIDWSDAECNKYNFEITKTPESGFTNAEGKIVLQSGTKKIQIVLKGLIKINGKWRLSFIDIEAI
jgi:hypothetical protein